jgi:hypothetical protein
MEHLTAEASAEAGNNPMPDEVRMLRVLTDEEVDAVSGGSTFNGGSGGDRPSESISLNFVKITLN